MRLLTLSILCLAMLAFALYAQRGQARSSGCDFVSGAIAASFTSATTVAGTVTGSLSGTVSAVITDIQPSGDGALHVQLQHTFVTAGGNLNTRDLAVLSPVDPPLYRMDTRYTINGGTGIYENATGFLHNHGDLNLDTGTVSLKYNGRFCSDQ